MGSEKTPGPAGSEIQRRGTQTAVNEVAHPNKTDANDLGALALFGSEAESSTEPAAVHHQRSSPSEDLVRNLPEDPVRNLRTRLAADTRSSGFRLLLSRTAALKLGAYASTARSLLAPRLREYLVRHPKLPAQAGLIASIVVAAVIVGHYVGRIDVLTIDPGPSQASSPSRVASEPLTSGPPVTPTPIPALAAQRQPADRPTDVRNAQLPPAPKTQAPKPQRSTTRIDNSNTRPRKAESPRPREIARETSTVPRTGAAGTVIAPPPSVPAVGPVVPASVRPTAPPPPSPVQTTIGNHADSESSGPIYSAQDVDVRPPQMLEADLPRPAVTNWPTIKNSMEVVVTENGSVQRVKWLTTRERMPDVMLLSRAKLWKFSPALRDGRPVRYRLIVTWEVNP